MVMAATDAPTLPNGVIRAAPSTNRPPSPPYIHIPTRLHTGESGQVEFVIKPSYDAVATRNITADEAKIVTGGKTQTTVPTNVNQTWRYEDRRRAQPITDFLYLGPIPAARDREWLRKEGITLFLAARDSSMAHIRLMAVEKAAEELGIERDSIDTASQQELIRSFRGAADKINDHMLRVHQSYQRRGKALIFCETGNERSAAVVAAYLMTMYGCDMVQAVQFVGSQRFAVNFSEPIKQLLQTYSDLLQAERMIPQPGVSQAQREAQSSGVQLAAAQCKKRGIEATMDDEERGGLFSLDKGRYEDRPAFAPFVEDDGMADIDMDVG